MHRLITSVMVITTLTLLAACQNETTSPVVEEKAPILVDGFEPNLPAAALTERCEQVMGEVEAGFASVEQGSGPATLETVVGAYDAATQGLNDIVYVYHMKEVHPDDDIRSAATDCSVKIDSFIAHVGLSRGYYDRLVAIDQDGLSETEQYMLKKVITAYELAGVSRDQETRDKIRALHEEIAELGNAFNRNIREDVRYVETTTEKLAGLPEDYLAAHPADENGVVRISTDYPDYVPVQTYGHDDELRRQLRVAARARGYPANDAVLSEILTKRAELADLLGFDTFAELSMKNRMIDNPSNAANFLASIRTALEAPVERELEVLLNRLRQIDPDAEEVQVWQQSYLTNLLRQEDYALDSKLVRTYFTYERVRDGIFQLTEDLFGVTIEPWQTETWHEEVETYQIMEDGQLLGRFYMDNHPRANKYKHAAHWTIRSGIKDVQIPISALAQNFPKGLMEHSQVETFLHEFGHLLHNIFAGTQEWSPIAGMSMERDFVEAPSQMLEEWIWDYDTISKFAINAEGETIPKELVEKMNNARDFGKATGTATQIYYARLSLDFYSQRPGFDLDEATVKLAEEYSPFPFVEGTHFWANFGHLYGYSSNYYTYQWSLAISTDLFSRFKEEGLRNKETADEYRRAILEVGGSKPAAEFVAEFLGRDFTPDAYIEWLKTL